MIIKIVYYTYRNLIYYRIPRKISSSRLMDVTSSHTAEDIKHSITNSCLATVGLKVAISDDDTIPWYIPLSKIQKDWIKLVSEHGYKVGLT